MKEPRFWERELKRVVRVFVELKNEVGGRFLEIFAIVTRRIVCLKMKGPKFGKFSFILLYTML